MTNPAIGRVSCAHCGALATVHQEKRGIKKALYYRCGDPVSGDGCGTVQIRGATGQLWLRQHMQPLDVAGRDAVRVDAGDEAAEEARAVAVKIAANERKKSGFLESVADFWGMKNG